VAALGSDVDWNVGDGRRLGSQRGNRVEQSPAVAD
jgi:hypothetical protein